jgi:hypothetical protein
LVDAVSQQIGMLSPDRLPLFENKIALDYHGLTQEEWLKFGKETSIVHPDDLERVLNEHTKGIHDARQSLAPTASSPCARLT